MSKLFGVLAAMLITARAAQAAASGEDEARRALERGDIHPLNQVLDLARKRMPGDVVKIGLAHDEGRWIYEIRILTENGDRREVEIDASSLSVLEID